MNEITNTGTILAQPESEIGRKYLPTFADLIDRLSIVILKSVFISEHHDAYMEERKLIEHDIAIILGPKPEIARGWIPLTAEEISAVMIIMLANRFIWENEAKARLGGSEQDKLLKLTHSINGVRNRAKNILAKYWGHRQDLKIDSFAADLDPAFGNWNLFEAEK
jgi:hypothetical protein